MAHQPPFPKSLHSFPITSSSLKIKTLLHAYIFRHMSHAVRALACTKSMIVKLLNNKRSREKKKEKLFSSVRMCCSWPSSHVRPMPEPAIVEGLDSHANHAYYDSTWNSIVVSTDDQGDEDVEPPLSGYLRWLEEKDPDGLMGGSDDGASEIDRLAERFIERCHEKFRLEKQESYRRYQEMLARSM